MKETLSDHSLKLILSRESMTLTDGMSKRDSAMYRQSGYAYHEQEGAGIIKKIERDVINGFTLMGSDIFSEGFPKNLEIIIRPLSSA